MTDFLDTKELARRWRMAPATLEKWRAANKGPPYLRISRGKVIYPYQAILDYEQQSDRSTP